MKSHVILTVLGSDRPGLTQALADGVLAAGGNWLESRLSQLGGKYVGSVLVEIEDDARNTLEEEVRKIDATGLRVVIVQAEQERGEVGKVMWFELVGQDRPGIVREVTSVLTGLGVNIEDMETSLEMGAWSGERLFRAELRLSLPDGTTSDDVQAALEAISGEIMVDFTINAPARA
ncbi:MAG: amino acid-binding protein [Novosphingobium sp.]|nr:amino acid-binding protein [Novosphingobium sp.]